MKKALMKILSVFLVVVITLTSAPLSGLVGLEIPEWLDFSLVSSASSVDYSDLTQNQYMTKILLNHNYNGCMSPSNGGMTKPQEQLSFFLNLQNASSAKILLDEIAKNETFQEAVIAWEIATFEPEEMLETTLKQEDYYIAILMSILDAQMNDSEFLDAWNCSTNKTILSLSKSTSSLMESLLDKEISDLKSVNVADLSDEQFNRLMNNIGTAKESKNLYSCLGDNLSIITDVSKACTTVYDVVQTVSTYSQIADLNKAVEDVLLAVYENCPDGTPVESAALKVYNISTEKMSQALFASLEGFDAITNAAFSYCMGKVWDFALDAALGSFSASFQIGQAIGKSISNFCFSTDAIIEQFYVLDAVYAFEQTYLGAVNTLANKYKADESIANADSYMKSIEILFSLYDLDGEYTYNFASTAREKGLYNTITSLFGKDETLETYRNAILSMRKARGLMKETLTTIEGYRWSYEDDAPAAYSSCFDVPKELPNETPAYSETEEIINIFPVIEPEINTGILFNYKIESDFTITITECNPSSVGNLIIPNEIGGFIVDEIASSAFLICSGITSVEMPTTMKKINHNAFSGCIKLAEVNLNYGLEYLGHSVFKDTCITSITIPETITKMYSNGGSLHTFSGANSLKTVIFEDGMTEIPSSALHGCSSVISVTIPDTVTSIGNSAFYDCTSLSSIVLPDSLKTIGDSAFWGCTSFTSITTPYHVERINHNAFSGCIKLAEVNLNYGLEYLGHSVFKDTCITSITIPETITKMYSNGGSLHTFSGANSLKTVIFEDGMTEISSSALRGCSSVTSVTIPDTVTSIGNSAFYDCTALSDIYYLGNEIEWEIVEINSNNEPLLNATIHFLGVVTHECLYESVVTLPTCTEKGYTTYICECGDNYVDDYVDALGHSSANEVEENFIAPTCTKNGSKDVVVYCSVCNEEINRERVSLEAIEHKDTDNNGYCDNCDEQVCDHRCHKNDIFWKIIKIFNRIFGTNKYCECGVAHY